MGEPAANPYLYMAANLAAGLDGIRRKLEPPPPVESDPYAAAAPMLPTSLADAGRLPVGGTRSPRPGGCLGRLLSAGRQRGLAQLRGQGVEPRSVVLDRRGGGG